MSKGGLKPCPNFDEWINGNIPEYDAVDFVGGIYEIAKIAWDARAHTENKQIQYLNDRLRAEKAANKKLEQEKVELIDWLELVKKDIEDAFKGKLPFDEVCSDAHSGIEEKLYKLKGGDK